MAEIDHFLPLLMQEEEDGLLSPVLLHGSVHFLWIKHSNLYRILNPILTVPARKKIYKHGMNAECVRACVLNCNILLLNVNLFLIHCGNTLTWASLQWWPRQTKTLTRPWSTPSCTSWWRYVLLCLIQCVREGWWGTLKWCAHSSYSQGTAGPLPIWGPPDTCRSEQGPERGADKHIVGRLYIIEGQNLHVYI